MDSKAIKLIDMVLKHEGGYANVSGDLGGETYRGISRKNFPSWNGWEIVDEKKPLKYNQIIKDSTLENDVRQFYYDEFYSPMRIDEVDSLLISGHLLCHGVNAGIKNSVKCLQKAINKTYGTKLKIDGIIGENTLKYTNGEKQNELAENFIAQRNAYYENIVKKRPSQEKFLNGWLNRVKNTTKTCSGSNMLLTGMGSGKLNIISMILKFIFKLIKLIFNKK